MKRTNLFLDDEDRRALGVIRETHGLPTDSSAARFAIRETARGIERQAKRSQQNVKAATVSGTGPAREDRTS